MRLLFLILVVSIGAFTVFGQKAQIVVQEQWPQEPLDPTVDKILQILKNISENVAPKRFSRIQPSSDQVKKEMQAPPVSVVLTVVKVLMEAVKKHNDGTLLRLFNTTEEDQKNIGSFINAHQGIDANVLSAKYDKDGGIEANLVFSYKQSKLKVPVQWFLNKNSDSPVGWKINGISQGSVSQKEQRSFVGVGSMPGGTVLCPINLIACLTQIIFKG